MNFTNKDLLKIINKTVLLDINYSKSSEKVNLINRNLLPKWHLKSIYYSILLFFLLLIKEIITFRKNNTLEEDAMKSAWSWERFKE